MYNEQLGKNDYILSEAMYGSRIDIALSRLTTLSRNEIKSLILKNYVKIKNHTKKLTPAYIIKQKCEVTIHFPKKNIQDAKIEKAKKTFSIIYEDDDIIIINKPSGIVVHPGAGNTSNTLVNQLISYTNNLSSVGGTNRLGIVHRLDKNTSGLMIVAKNDKSHVILAKDLQLHKIERKYYALIWGMLKNSHATIDINLGRSRECFKKIFAFTNPTKGKKSITHYKLLNTYYSNIFSSVECALETGRTHQIRVHMNHIKHPIVGDDLYGNNKKKVHYYTNDKVKTYLQNFNRHALHSCYIKLTHPIKKNILEFRIDLPKEIKELIDLIEKHQ